MRDILINQRITNDKIISLSEYSTICDKVYVGEYILYGDNILEGITMLNLLSQEDGVLTFYGVIYEPIDQPIYLFQVNTSQQLISIKICGAYDKWELPLDVARVVDYIDLTDYVIYSKQTNSIVIAGENTETASVGNSQWQREGRKIGAARVRVPFIYQTFYSGKDESQSTIREPNSLQVYNQLVYTIRYRVPSFVAYFENNFEGASTRQRYPNDCSDLFIDYIKTCLVHDLQQDKETLAMKRALEERFILHMLSYLAEGSYSKSKGIADKPRLHKDFPIINSKVYNAIINTPQAFAKDIVSYIYGELDIETFYSNYPIDDINEDNLHSWAGYRNKRYISNLINYIEEKGEKINSYISGQAQIGLAPTIVCREFLTNKFPNSKKNIYKILDVNKYPECIIMPLRLHKSNNQTLTFSPDPESGEIVAFGELLGKNCINQKLRPIIGYAIVDTPNNFDLDEKVGTKLYKALSYYIDILILNDSTIISEYQYNEVTSNYSDTNLSNIKPMSCTEEMAIVSTYLNQSTINSNWQLCFIHTHHSSWQQMMVYKPNGLCSQHKIDRVSTKVDLIMQDADTFMIAEGKDAYVELMRDHKIHRAMIDAGRLVDTLYSAHNKKFNAFIYNLHIASIIDPEYYIEREIGTIEGAIDRGHFNEIASENNYVVIIVSTIKNKTHFNLVYSQNFDTNLKQQLDKEFKQ